MCPTAREKLSLSLDRERGRRNNAGLTIKKSHNGGKIGSKRSLIVIVAQKSYVLSRQIRDGDSKYAIN